MFDMFDKLPVLLENLVEDTSEYRICISLEFDLFVAEEEKDLRFRRSNATKSEVFCQVCGKHRLTTTWFASNPEKSRFFGSQPGEICGMAHNPATSTLNWSW